MAFVRLSNEADIPAILSLYRQLALPDAPENFYQDYSPENCKRAFADMGALPGYQLLVVEEEANLIGTATLAVLPGLTHAASPFAIVEYFVVDENYRRRGIGRLLMEYINACAREAGCYKIMLTSDKRRPEAHRFYQSLGFEASAEGFRYYFK